MLRRKCNDRFSMYMYIHEYDSLVRVLRTGDICLFENTVRFVRTFQLIIIARSDDSGWLAACGSGACGWVRHGGLSLVPVSVEVGSGWRKVMEELVQSPQ